MKENPYLFGMVTIVASLCLSTRPADAAKYATIDVKDGGTIAGIVRWDGEIPKRHNLKVSGADQPCHTKPIPNDHPVCSKEAKLRWLAASIKNID